MNALKKISAVVLVIAVLVGSFAVSFLCFKKGTYEIKTEYLSVFDRDQNTYYLQKADPFIIFRIDIDASEDSGYSLFDSDGDPVKAETERFFGNCFDILPPERGYRAGERYTLTLADNAHFRNEALKNAKKLVFCIERPGQAAYEFTDSVVETAKPIKQTDENTVILPNGTFQNGDILFGQNANEEYVAYKISEIGENGTASVTVPALDELYSELEVYGEYDWDVSQLVSNPDLEIEIAENVRKSSFYDSLMLTAYAAEKPRDGKFDVKVTPDTKENSVEIEIKITLEPGENGLFGIGQLRNQQVTLTLSAKFGLKTNCNIQGITNWDVSATVTTGFSWKIEISLYTDEWKKDSDLAGLFSENNKFANLIDYQKNVKKITDKLNQISADITGGEIKLFDWKLPIPSVPGLYFSTEIKLFAKFEIAADIVVGQDTETVYTVGLCFIDHQFDTYSNTYRSGDDVQLSLRGKAKVKAGIKLVFKATLISDGIANINIDPQVGLYAELYVTFPITGRSEITDDNFIYSYFEPGAYFSANINATLNVLVKKFEFSYELIEKKFPIDALTFGNKKIAVGLTANAGTVRAVNGLVSLPDILFEYFDVKKGITDTERISSDKLKFVTNDGTKLKVTNGKIQLPEASASDSVYVTASYLHTDGKTYSTVFRTVVSGSVLEGKVSAYTSDLTTGELAEASVALYPATNGTSPISTVKTDQNGKFYFNVSPGDYRLVISADGYRTLTSYQSVAEDEIKYTEHILLMDNTQSGNGSAAGTVSNALNGKGLSNVTIRLRRDWNNTSGVYEDFETSTDASGKYYVTGIPVGYYTVEASLDGYVTGHSNVIVLATGAKEDFDFTITPILSDDEIRIVLSWGATPSDLDSHLIGKTPAGNDFNVYYRNKVYKYDGVEMANLDVDDTSSYGPETITVFKNIYGIYTYAVHDYTNRYSGGSTALSFSNAVVKVFMGSRQVAEYHVPTDQIGTYWTVFQMDRSGRILPINSISNDKPIAE